MATTSNPTDAADREIVITRVFDAPRDLVWKAWTQPEHIAQWWGPRGFSTTVTAMDLRVGGRWRYVMHGPDGSDYPVEGVFREVVPLERIVTTDEFPDDFKPPVPMDLPRGIVVTALFAAEGAKTRLTLRILHDTVEGKNKHAAMGVVGGWNSSFDCMDDHLAALQGAEQLRQLIEAQQRAIGAKDVAAIMALYAPDLVAFDVKPPFRIAGADAWRKVWDDCFPYFPDSFRVETRDLVVSASGDSGFAHWMFRFITPDPGHPAAQAWMRVTACYRKLDGAWKIVHEHCSVPFDPYTGKAVLTLEV